MEIKEARKSAIHPTNLLAENLIWVDRPYYLVFVQSKKDKKFYETISRINNPEINCPIIFEAITCIKEEKNEENENENENNSRYKLIRIIDSILATDDTFIKKELTQLRDMIFLRDKFSRNSNESRIIDFIEVIKDIKELRFVFAILDRKCKKNETIQNNKILYTTRKELNNHILDPIHLYFYLKEVRPYDKLNKHFENVQNPLIKPDGFNESSINELQDILNSLTEKMIRNSNKENDDKYDEYYFIGGKSVTLRYPLYFLKENSSELFISSRNMFINDYEVEDMPEEEEKYLFLNNYILLGNFTSIFF